MEEFIETLDLNILLKCCRVCERPDQYSNLFYNINKELLRNFAVLVNEYDGLSKWVCRECAETIETFINFKNKYDETSQKFLAHLQAKASSDAEEQIESVEIESLGETVHKEFSALPGDIEDEESIEVCEVEDEADAKDNHQEITIEESPNAEGEASKNFQCEVCLKTYQYQNSLVRHVKTTHENLRHTCFICDSEFTQRTSLNEHIRNLHKQECTEVFECNFNDSCNRAFNTAKMLHQHTKHHYSDSPKEKLKTIPGEPANKKKYRKQCQICGLFFKHIEEHKLSHQSENTFRCQHPACGKSFKFKTSLDVHIRIHNNERKFQCEICHKKFRVSHHLKEHGTVHLKEKTFACEEPSCSKKFSSKLNLYKHSKLHLNKKSVLYM